MTATVLPNNATDKGVVWSTSDEAIATVSTAGVVTAVKAGTATITATTKVGAKKATCTVTVTNPVVNVVGVSLNKATTSIVKGSKETLTATINPSNATDKTVTWTSSAEAIATVSTTGEVTAVSAGTADITVTTKSGNKTAKCTVTVTEAPQG